MYSPKISEDLIPVLYKIKNLEDKTMREVVDLFLRESIEKYGEKHPGIYDEKQTVCKSLVLK